MKRSFVQGCYWSIPVLLLVFVFYCIGYSDLPSNRLSSNGIVTTTGSWFGFSETVDRKYQQITVVDSQKQVMAVYQVDLASGAIKICSVRKLSYDMQIENLNTQKPLPQEIRSLLESQ